MIDFGLSRGDFAADYFERRYFLRRQALDAKVFDWEELDAVLYRIEPQAPAMRLFQDGPVDEDAYTETTVEFGAPRRRLNKARFLRLLHAGATLVVNRMENHSLPVRRLCAEVGRFARGVPVSNAYLSLGGDGTFGRHWDTHDVFALQLIGRKRWQVFAPTFPLPLGMHTSAGGPQACPAEPLIDTVLEAGDLLYLPRGFWHRALPLAGASLHVSVGTYGPTVHDYVMWVCANRLGELVTARGALSRTGRREAIEDVAGHLADLLRDESNVAAFEAEQGRRELQPAEFNTELFFAVGADGLSPPTRIVMNTWREPQIVAGELLYGNGKLRLNGTCAAVVERIAAARSTSLAELFDSLPDADREAVRLAVLDLELHGVVTIIRSR